MQSKFCRLMALLLTFALLFSMLPMGVNAVKKTPDGEYSINFNYHKDDTNDRSVMNDYVDLKSGKLIISNGQVRFEHVVTLFKAFQHFSVRMPGKEKAVINGANIVGIDGYLPVTDKPSGDGSNPDYAVVSYDIENIEVKQDILIHIVIPTAQNYDNWYNLQLQLDLSGLPTGEEHGGGGNSDAVTLEQLEALFTITTELLNTTSEGTGDGFYLLGSQTAFQNTINQARGITDSAGSSNLELIKAAYLVLQEGKKKYDASRITVSKTILVQTLEQYKQFATTVKNIGTAAGTPGVAHAVLSDGEYRVGAIQRISQWLNDAKVVVEDIQASQNQVNTTLVELTNKVENLKKEQFKKEILPLLVLDPATGEISDHADDFKKEVSMFTTAQAPFFDAYAHVVFAEPKDSTLVLSLYGPSKDGAVSNTTLAGYKTRIQTGYGEYQAYQFIARHQESNDSIYQGLSKLEYTIGSVKKTVLLSYNANQLNALNASITAAHQLHTAAVVGLSEGQYEESSKTTLFAAIELAEQTSKKLNATRPQIASAAKALEQSVLVFQGEKIRNIPFAVLHKTNAVLSTMDRYLLKPASIMCRNGETFVSLVIKDSDIVVAFKIYQGDSPIDATIVSTDTVAKTRVVKFKVTDLTTILPAQVRISMPNVIDPSTQKPYDATHDIRLLFDNADPAKLKSAIATARTVYDSAVVGTSVGQYPQAAKDTFFSAIGAANAIAGNVIATKQQFVDAETTLTQALIAFQATKIAVFNPEIPTGPVELADGKYTIQFDILKKGTSQRSVMDEYVAHPGRLLVQNGVKYVQINLKQSKEVNGFTVEGSTITTLDSDSSANTRRVQFTVAELPAKLSSWVKIDWPEMKYHHEYDIDIQLGSYKKVDSWEGESFGSVIDRELPVEQEKKEEELKEKDKNAGSGPVIVFKDLANNWAKTAIDRAVKLSIVQGYPDGTFKPNATVNRAEWAVILGRALKLESKGTTASFADMSNIPVWARTFVEHAAAAGIINGYEDQTFRPAQKVSRTEIAVMVVRALQLPLEPAGALSFVDAAEIPAYAQPYIATAVKHGLINGFENNQFGGSKPATRATAITLVLRVIDYLEVKALEQEKAEVEKEAEKKV